ncbi:cytochrome P450 [Hysterangium stoloniferum]|nr:cytochrome P450 [Hysterangium stoloniferum]
MAPSNVPPGLQFMGYHLHKVMLPILLVYCFNRFASITLSNNLLLIAYILATPAATLLYTLWYYLDEQRKMWKLKARSVPIVPSRIPGGFDTLFHVIKCLEAGGIGEPWGQWMEALGPIINYRLFGQDAIITTEPAYIKAMLTTDMENFEKGPHFNWTMRSVLGNGVFNSDGEMWKGMTRPFFSRDRITDFELFSRHGDLAIAKMKERLGEGDAIDFQDVMSRHVTNLRHITESLFGSCVHSLSAPLPYAHDSPKRQEAAVTHPSERFADAFSFAQRHIAMRAQLAEAWPLAEFWQDKTKESMEVINQYLDPILKAALAKRKSSPVPAKEKEISDSVTLLDHLVQNTADFDIIRDEVLNILLAGRDTTMATLTFVIYCLSQNPSVLATLRAEILETVGSSQIPTYEAIKECRYLRAVINETLRLYPPVPLNFRRCKNSITWPARDGGLPFYIPGGVDVAYSTWLMHRRTDLWGPDAEIFDPDRFLDARAHKYLAANPFIFLPFNAGPRICLGQQFAYNEVSCMLVRILQSFDSIALIPEAQPPLSRPKSTWTGKEKICPKSHLTLYSDMGLWLTMAEAVSTDTP